MRAFLLVLALFFNLPVSAQTASEQQKLAESSLQLNGSLVIAADGHVLSHALDSEVPLAPALTTFIAQTINSWRFQPILVAGKPVKAKVMMHMRLVASRAGDDKLNIRIASTQFGKDTSKKTTAEVHSLKLSPPQYPARALQWGASGAVYLIAQIGRDGKVHNIDAEQVNLFVVGNASQMEMLRKQLADAAIRAGWRWTFTTPSTGEEANADSWLVRVPVEFRLGTPGKPGQWQSYIPGPRNIAIPWAQEELKLAGSPDALPSSGVFPLNQGVQLLPPPAG